MQWAMKNASNNFMALLLVKIECNIDFHPQNLFFMSKIHFCK